MRDKPSCPIFDFHTHCFPDAIAAKTMKLLGDGAGIPYHHDGSYAGLCEYEREAAGFLVLPIATKPSQTHSILQFAAAINGDGKARSLGSVHPRDPEYEHWLKMLVDMGFKGVKLHPEYQDFYVDDDSLLDYYDAVFKRGLFLVLHAGEDLGFENPDHGAPERIAWLCDRFPQARIVAAHMGGFNQWDLAEQCLSGRRNLWMDCSFAATEMTGARFAAFARGHGIDRVLFGTDSPWKSFSDTVSAVMSAGLSQDEQRAVFWDNATRLLG